MATSGTLDPRCTKLDLPERVYATWSAWTTAASSQSPTMRCWSARTTASRGAKRGPVYTGPPPGVPGGGMLLRTQNDWIVMVYADSASFIWNWNDETRSADRNAKLDVWAIRSPDGGKTWLDRQRIMEGYCGALITMIELDRGGIVVPVQIFLRDPDRHAMTSLQVRGRRPHLVPRQHYRHGGQRTPRRRHGGDHRRADQRQPADAHPHQLRLPLGVDLHR